MLFLFQIYIFYSKTIVSCIFQVISCTFFGIFYLVFWIGHFESQGEKTFHHVILHFKLTIEDKKEVQEAIAEWQLSKLNLGEMVIHNFFWPMK